VAAEPITHRPIACSLNGAEYRNRVQWIEDLTRRALREHRRDDLKLHLIYLLEARADVHLMVAQERACCGFLTFAVEHEPDAITVTVIVPEAARGAVDMLFAPFVAGHAAA